MPRKSQRKIREPQPGPSNRMDVDSESDSDEEISVSQVSRNMKRINVSQANKKGKARGRQLSSGSEEEEEPRPSKSTQKMNGTQKVQRRTNARLIDSDSDEEPQPSTSQAAQKKRRNNASQSVSQRANHMSQASTSAAADTFMGDEISASQISPNTSLTEQEHNLHVANVVKYILSADQQKKTPILKTSISKAMNCHNKNFREVFQSAQDVLRNVFGYELLNVEDENDSKTQGKQSKGQKFILLNSMGGEDLNEDADEETSIRYILLFLCLSHIFMSGTKCSEESLKNFLMKLGIVLDQHTINEQFGDAMRTVMDDFVKEKYINVEGSENDKELTWGIRAIKELKPRSVMEFASQIYDGRSLNTWPREYENLLKMERGANQRPNGQMNGTQH